MTRRRGEGIGGALAVAAAAALLGCGDGGEAEGAPDGATSDATALLDAALPDGAPDATPDATAATDAAPPAAAFEIVVPALRDARWADARCNDGTPFAFFLSRAPASDDWMIYLQGGVMCDDSAVPCSEREASLTTTIPLADGATAARPFEGLGSRDPAINPDFAGANLVVAHYCSSDFWSGATTERRPSSGDPAQGWYFSGHRNVEALFEILADRYGLDDARPSLHVLFGGGSAGAFGAHFNASRVEALLPATAAAGRLALFADAGWWADWDDPEHRFFAATTGDFEAARVMRTFWGATFDPACEEAEADPVTCLFGIGWYPYVHARLPVFVQQSREDGSFGVAGHGLEPGSPAMAAWHQAVEGSLAGVDWLHSGSMPYHTLGMRDDGLGRGPAGSTLREMLGRFWRGGAPERVLF